MRSNYQSRLLMLALLVLPTSTSPVFAAGVLVVVMEHKDGSKMVHNQVVDRVDCGQVVERLRISGPFTMKLAPPEPRTGRVIEAYCVLPDGSIEPPPSPEVAKRMPKS